MALLWTLEISIQKNSGYEISMQDNHVSHVFWTKEDMASCSRNFESLKNADKERKIIENTARVNMWSDKVVI